MNGFDVKEKGKLPALPLEVLCPNCRKPLQLYTYAQARTVVCGVCSRLSEVQERGLVQIRAVDKEKQEPLIPIGTEGRIKGILYKVVGFLVHKEQSLKYRWREYVLFNPVHGYAFLSEYDGHWTFFQFISDISNGAKRTTSSLYYRGSEYKLYNKYRSQVLYAQGEFFWEITEDNSEYLEYVAPPYMLTLSVNKVEQTWLLGEHIEPEMVQETFSIAAPMPYKIDVGAVEPFSQNFSLSFVSKMAGGAAALLLLIQVLLVSFQQGKVLMDQTFTVTEDGGKGTLLPVPGPTVEIGSALGSSNVQVYLRAPVTNTWFATGLSLLNVNTGREYFVELGVEYYHGYEGGEHWKEGSTDTDQILSSIPSGTYRVYLQPSREVLALGTSLPESFHLKLVQDVAIWSNFWIALLLIAAVPVVQGIRHYSFEKDRWMNSDYSPYTQ
ncbi:DUF4178 domain-containing protein [Rufibacter psychrotolerans]|uniref:DUF4178 domain-containing protein n=1 Tax=Rufibacter psychrotolerans TaxID=2812556 RepID=UPI0019678DAA|nr:DUF4178 domain-containing protein [Rufibacter sp. SYSU D00308]